MLARPVPIRPEELAAHATRLRDAVVRHRFALLVALVGIGFDVGFTVWYVWSEFTVYFWDYGYYWKESIFVAQSLSDGIFGAAHSVIGSVRNNEYNLLLALPLGVLMLIFGESRMTYELGILLLYAVPTAAMLAALVYKLTARIWPERYRRRWILVGLFLLIVVNPIILLPILLGYADILGLLPFAAALWLYADRRLRPSYRLAIGVALLLLVATLLRRWYIFGGAGTFIAIGLDQAYLAWRTRDARERMRRVSTTVAMPAVFMVAYFVVAWPYVLKLINTPYGNTYAAYKEHSNHADLAWIVTQHFGILYLLPVLAGSVVILRGRRPQRAAGVVVLVAAIASFVFVGRIQTFNVHHYYLLTPAILVALGVTLAAACKYLANRWVVVAAGVVALYSVLFLAVYQPVFFGPLLPDSSAAAPPDRRGDIEQLQRLYNDLAAAQMGTNSIFIVASSTVINRSTIQDLPFSVPVAERIDEKVFIRSADLDIRDGFNVSFFDAELVVDSDPPGYIVHDITQQSVNTALHAALQRGGMLHGYYLTTATYPLDGGATAFLLERTSVVPSDVREEFVNLVRAMHSGAVRIYRSEVP